MKYKILKLSTIILLPITFGIAFISAGCQKDELPPLEDKTLTVIETNSNGCKESLKSSEIEQFVEIEAVNKNQLKVKFINAFINCCPGEITANAIIEDNILKVSFMEEKAACNCICYFDFECIIDSMENREYNIEVYGGGKKAKFAFVFSEKLSKKVKITND